MNSVVRPWSSQKAMCFYQRLSIESALKTLTMDTAIDVVVMCISENGLSRNFLETIII